MIKFKSFPRRDITDFIDDSFLQYEWWILFSGEEISVKNLHIRWVLLRSDQTLYEFTQILLFAEDRKSFWKENFHICDRIHDVISYLKWGQKSHIYMKVLLIVTKYLDGIKRFFSKNRMQGLSSCRQLFEWVFIAIIREVHFIKLEMC